MSMMPSHPDELGDEIVRVKEILADAEESTALTAWEEEFCDSMRERILQYGEQTRVSEKQMEIIDRIERKLYG